MKSAIIILAAGKSERFRSSSGYPKSLYPFKQKTWLEYIVDSYHGHDIKIITGFDHELFYEKLPHLQHLFIFNANHLEGPFTSIQTAIRDCLDYDQIVICPVDMAPIKTSSLNRLIQAKNNNALVKPFYNKKGGHPIVIRKSLFDTFLNLSAESSNARLDVQIRSLSRDQIENIEIDDKAIVSNFNNVSDFLGYFENV